MGHVGLRRFLAGPGVGGEFLDCLQFLPPNQIQPLDQIVDPGAYHGLSFLAQPGQGGNRSARDAGEVVEEFGVDRSWANVLLLHQPAFASVLSSYIALP